jgi:hypothetical protein
MLHSARFCLSGTSGLVGCLVVSTLLLHARAALDPSPFVRWRLARAVPTVRVNRAESDPIFIQYTALLHAVDSSTK